MKPIVVKTAAFVLTALSGCIYWLATSLSNIAQKLKRPSDTRKLK